jgi:hypothetical protein
MTGAFQKFLYVAWAVNAGQHRSRELQIIAMIKLSGQLAVWKSSLANITS